VEISKLERIVARVLSMHDRGLLCPAEMWNIIADCLDGENVESKINDLSESTRRSLASQTLDPRHLNQDLVETRQAIFVWCQRNRVPS
jgi:hypothetical protein